MFQIRLIFFLTFFSILCLLLSSCADEYDAIEILSNGNIQFTSRFVIKDNLQIKDLEGIFGEISKDLNKRGWQASYSISKDSPIEVVMRGKGNIKNVAPSYVVGAGPVYQLRKVSNVEYELFLNAIGNQYKRFVKFENSTLSSNAKVKDSDGKAVKRLELTDKGTTVRIVLN
jgi:hypothetical protein